MPSAFLVIRAVFFALVAYLHGLILIFVSWNIATAKSFRTSAPGAPVFVILSSVLTLALVLIALLARAICRRARPAHVRVECAWTTLMSNFQLAASISMTVNGSPIDCQMDLPWAMCASYSLLVHISWLATLITLTYCLTICVASAAHAATLPDIWVTPVPLVPWFRQSAEGPPPVVIPSPPTHKRTKTLSSLSSWSEGSCALSEYTRERWERLSSTERQPVPSGPISSTNGRSVDSRRPAWARQQLIRRGIDCPFARPLPERKGPVGPLNPPPKTLRRQVVAISRDPYVWGEQLETRVPSYSTSTPRTSVLFPLNIADPDLPVHLSSPSECVRADASHKASLSSD